MANRGEAQGGGARAMQDGRRPVVAVVDDDEAVRESLRFLLDIAGYEVITFDSAQDYLDRVHCRPATCLVVDQHMPNTTGLELLASLRQLGAQLPTALITGSPTSDIVRQATALGVACVLEKPLVDDALLRFLACAAAGACAS
jgi:two-component system, LuxR family, response regulator FixJ